MTRSHYSPIHKAVPHLAVLLLAAVVWLLVGATGAGAVTINVIDSEDNPISTGFRWLLEIDNSNQSTPQVPSATSIGLDIHKSHTPVLDEGVVSGSTVTISVPDPEQRYFISVLPTVGYTMSGGVIHPGQDEVNIIVHAYNPAEPYNSDFPDVDGIPTAQISILVFEDNWPINNAPDDPERGLADFTVVVADAGGVLSQDVYGNPLGTTYTTNPDGSLAVDILGTGVILTDVNGEAVVKYLAPGKYGVTITPPTTGLQDPSDPTSPMIAVDWIQTATIEGSKTVDAWVKANEAETFVEGFGTGFVHAFFGFVRLDTLPWALNPPTVDGNPPDGTNLYTGTISGQNRYNHFSKPPSLQGYFPGAPVPDCLMGLNDPVSGQGLMAVECDGDSNFLFENLPPGTYELVSWDRALDALFGFRSATVPAELNVTGDDAALGDVLSFRWFGQLKGTVFNDTDEDGFRDPGESGILEQNINIRFRDGTIYQAQPTDVEGGYDLAEVFPFFKWLVVEVDFASFKATGMTAAVDDGGEIPPANGWIVPSFGVLNPQPQVEINPNTGNNLSRTEKGEVLTQAMHLFLGQANVIDWGKTTYGPGENGGISGMVIYAVTRAEDDPRWTATEPWEPGIPRVQVNLYRDSNQDDVIDDINNDGGPTPADVDNYPFGNFPATEDIDHNGNGAFDAGDAIQITYTDSWDDDPPSGCIQTLPIVAGQQVNECFDNFGTWNQVRPGVFDGGYAFVSYFPLGYGVGSEVDSIPPGRYIVEAANPNPNGYLLVKEEDKNVDFGDQWTPSPQLEPPYCVGELHTVPPYLSFQSSDGGYTPLPGIFPGDMLAAPYAGEERPLCDRKSVRVADGLNTAAEFHYFTQVPKAARVVGFSNNDLAAEFDPTSPIFGEKSAPSWLPVALRDWKGEEVVRVYMDEYGAYNAVLPSTFTVNLPTPTGVASNMIQVVLNDPGPIPDPDNPGEMITDPNYDPNYSVTPWTFQFEPGHTSYLDTPLVPLSAFAGYPKGALDTEPADGTPVITQISGLNGVPLACNEVSSATPTLVTLTSAGDALVDNPDYNPQDPNSIAQITRDFGFGDVAGQVLVDGTDITGSLADLVWSNDTITFTWPEGQATGVVTVTRDNGITNPNGITVNAIDCSTANNDILYVDDDYVSPLPPQFQTIQGAIDAAAAGDLILVAPGLYKENAIMYKPVALQGSGPGSTTISAAPVPTDRIADWHAKLEEILFGIGNTGNTTGFVPKEAPGIMVIGQDPLLLDTLAEDFATGQARIDGFQLTGSIAGGGIYVNNHAVNLEISNNLLQNNQGIHGGGIVIGTPQIPASGNHNVVIDNNRIQRNGGVQGAGGIQVYADSDGYTISNNVITGNLSRYSGAGISHIGSSPAGQIDGNEILFNEVFYGLLQAGGGSGGGIYVAGEIAGGDGAGNVTIGGNLIQGNLAGAGTGGGIAAFAFNGAALTSTLTVYNNMIVNNAAALGGGGISLQDVELSDFYYNTIAFNDSTSTAALAFPANNIDISTPRAAGILSFTHSLALQTALGVPGGYADPSLDSNIIWGNRSFFNDANLHGGQAGLVPASGHYGADQLYDEALGGGDPNNNTYLPDLTMYPDVWDLQVLGAPAGTQMNPVNSILSSLAGPFGEDYTGNVSDNPGFVKPYKNNIFSSTVADEGGNNISVRFRPLTAGAGDYHLATACSPALDGGSLLLAPEDIDGDDRATWSNGTNNEIGADEFDPTTQALETPTLTLVSPEAGAVVPANSRYTIIWGAPAEAVDFDLGYSLGNATTYNNIDLTGMISGSRCVNWNVPANIRNADNAHIGIVSRDSLGTELERLVSEPFSIDTIALIDPNGSELVVSGNTYTVTWTIEYAPSAVRAGAWYRFEGESDWHAIGSTAAIDSRIDWTLPAVSEETRAYVGLVLYDATGSPVLSDYSDAFFTIFPSGVSTTTITPATLASEPDNTTTTPTIQGFATVVADEPVVEEEPAVTLLIPNGGEYLVAGSEVPLLWSSPPTDIPVAAVELKLSFDNGATWQPVATLEGDPEYHAWTVPVPETDVSGVLVEVVRLDEQGETIDIDRSDESFTISTEGQ